MPLIFTVEDMKTPAKLERVFQQIRTMLESSVPAQGSVAAAVQNTPLDLDKLAAKLAPILRPQLQATGTAPLDTSILLPANITSITPGTGISISGSGDVTITNSGVTSATGTANQVNVSGATGAVTFSLPQNINSGASPMFAGLVLTSLLSKYSNVSTAGLGLEAVYAVGRATAQAGANGSIATYTPTADGSFIVSMNILITAFTAGTVSGVVTYTDEGGTPRSLTMNFSSITGTLGTTVGAAGAFEGVPLHLRVKASTAITVTTAVSLFTGTYNVEGIIRQLA